MAVVGLTMLGGCASGGADLGDLGVDDTIVTSSTGTAPPSADAVQLSDTATIRNAVSSADVSARNGEALAWANSDTGSRGSILGLVETKEDGRVCRVFTASRESFDGVGMYRGETCLADRGAWRMLAFERM